MEIWLILLTLYVYVVFILLGPASARGNRSSRMKPRVYVNPDEFLRIVARQSALVIFITKAFLRGPMYVIETGSYFFCCHSQETLDFPDGTETVQATAIDFS